MEHREVVDILLEMRYLECSIMKGTYDGGKFMLGEHV